MLELTEDSPTKTREINTNRTMMKVFMILAFVMVGGLAGQAMKLADPEQEAGRLAASLNLDPHQVEAFRRGVKMVNDAFASINFLAIPAEGDDPIFYQRAVVQVFETKEKADKDMLKETCSLVVKLEQPQESDSYSSRQIYTICKIVDAVQVINL